MKDFYPESSLDKLAETLEKYGVAVVPNILSQEECEVFKKSVFDHIATKHGVREPDDFAKLRPISGGILHNYGIALLKEVLDLKTDDRVIEPFRRIWPEENGALTTSLDGIHIGVPPELTTDKRFFTPANIWFHTDQASNKATKCCIQSFINLEDTQNGDGCLSVLTNSHNYHAEFFRHFSLSSHGKDWFIINKTTHFDWFIKKGCRWNTIIAPKGSMIFWDSRTIHMGTLPRQGRPHPGRWRFIVYVCYTPARLQTDEDTKLKRLAYTDNRCTAHWPYGVRLFNKPSDDTVFNDLNNLTERHKRYLGIN